MRIMSNSQLAFVVGETVSVNPNSGQRPCVLPHEFILKEYEILHAGIRNLDARVFQIKGWSITLFSALAALAITEKSPAVLIIATIAATFFWLIDGLYKSFQRTLINRSLEIEEQVNGQGSIEKILYASHSFELRDKTLIGRIKRVVYQMFVFNVAALYVIQIVVTVAIFLAFMSGVNWLPKLLGIAL